MLRSVLENKGYRLLMVNALAGPFGVRCLSHNASQGVSFTRGDGTAPRFYKNVNIGPVQGKDFGFNILLDNKPLKTPAGRPLTLPSIHLALAVAAEWEWQDSRRIQPLSMPLMALASTATDQPKPRVRIIEELLKFVDTDVVVCRDEPGSELEHIQNKAYAPLLSWFYGVFGVELKASSSLLGSNQSPETEAQIRAYLTGLDTWRLILVDAMIGGCRSVVIGLALLHGHLTVEEAIKISRVEEEFQIGNWGLVEGAHDIDVADLTAKLSAAKVFLNLRRL